jgi:glutamate-5-semialdehyde dehydrogenase
MTTEEMRDALVAIGEKAQAASRALAVLDANAKVECLNRMADELENGKDAIKKANAVDIDKGVKAGLTAAMLDRLRLDDARIAGMARGLREVASQVDPVGRLISSSVRPNGLRIDKVSVPLGVIAIIYESRPNVTADAAGICIKAGNAVILRGGSEAFASNVEIAKLLNRAAVLSGLPDGAVQLLPWTDRGAVNLMLKMDRYIDLVIPRGGESLIRAVTAESTIPVIKHYKGVCHIYVDDDADLDMAVKIVVNAKCQRPSACNAMETLLVNREIAPAFLKKLLPALAEYNVEIFGDYEFRKLVPEAKPMSDEQYGTEYLDFAMSAKIVGDVKEAVEHINRYGSRHSDAIVSDDAAAVNYFFANVDSATVYHNASTRFTDGGEFGMGAEIGISTDKLHARGPMGADELTSTKFIIHGEGQIRG